MKNFSETIKIREISSSDINEDFISLLGQLTDVKFNIEDLKEQFLEYKSTILVAEYHGKIIGTASLFIEPKLTHGGKSVGHIEDVVIDSNFRGFGIGKHLIGELVNLAKSSNCYKVILNCSDANISFYEKCGFSNVGNTMRYNLCSQQ